MRRATDARCHCFCGIVSYWIPLHANATIRMNGDEVLPVTLRVLEATIAESYRSFRHPQTCISAYVEIATEPMVWRMLCRRLRFVLGVYYTRISCTRLLVCAALGKLDTRRNKIEALSGYPWEICISFYCHSLVHRVQDI